MANILAVDDSASMRQMVAFTLKGAGHNERIARGKAFGDKRAVADRCAGRHQALMRLSLLSGHDCKSVF